MTSRLPVHRMPLDITHRDRENGCSGAADQMNISWQPQGLRSGRQASVPPQRNRPRTRCPPPHPRRRTRISKSASCRAEPAMFAASLPSAESSASLRNCSRSCMCAAASAASWERSSSRSTRTAAHAGLVQHGPSSGLGSAGFFRFREPVANSRR